MLFGRYRSFKYGLGGYCLLKDWVSFRKGRTLHKSGVQVGGVNVWAAQRPLKKVNTFLWPYGNIVAQKPTKVKKVCRWTA